VRVADFANPLEIPWGRRERTGVLDRLEEDGRDGVGPSNSMASAMRSAQY
jgi:hypothetical protein